MPHPAPDLLPRLLAGPLLHAAGASPVVIVTGARQTGKTTLVQSALAERDYDYLTLDASHLKKRDGDVRESGCAI